MEIAVNTIVALRYVMRNKEGDVLEDITKAEPVQYLHGGGRILPALENSVSGLKAGDKKVVSISPDTSDQLMDEYELEVIIDDVRWASEEELLTGQPADASILNCGLDCSC